MSDNLFETAKRIYKRDGDKVTNYFRCTVGLKKGKMVSDPSKCGQRANPKRVRHGRIVAKTRGAIRVKKSLITLKTHASKRIRELNARLNGLFSKRGGVHESLSGHIMQMCLSEYILSNAPDDATVDLILSDDAMLALEHVVDLALSEDHLTLIELTGEFYNALDFDVSYE